jgi:endogenous inhibitor of DNA gyrase (YacG/DUF329 family)
MKRASIAVLGGLTAGVVLVAIVAAETSESGLGSLPAGLGSAEWALPFVVGSFVGLFAWWALTALADRERPLHTEAACPACGRPILDDWRLCPECGTLVERASKGPEERPAHG